MNKPWKAKIMNKPSKFTVICFALAAAGGLGVSTISGYAQSAVATISDVAGAGGVFDYTITLQNNGNQNLNSFWYGWTTSGNNLPASPSSAGNSLGWANVLDGTSIQWENTTASPALGAGQSATFTFVSTSTLAAITTPPSGESVAYTSDSIQFNQGVAGQSTPVFSPTAAPVPEPSSFGIVAMGAMLMAGAFRRRIAARRS
jgi:hypothetical protein